MSCCAVPHVLLMCVTETRGNVPWDVGVDTMEYIVTNHAVNSVKTSNVSRMMENVYLV